MTLTWPAVIVLAFVITLVILLLGAMWRLIKTFIKLAAVILVVLVCVKLSMDAGLI